MTMTPTNFDLLVTALESGEYHQAQGMLRDEHVKIPDPNNEGERVEVVGYCCLGVDCVIRGVDLDVNYLNPATEGVATLGRWGGVEDVREGDDNPLAVVLNEFSYVQRVHLARMNDSGATFAAIAAYLRENRAEFVSE